MPNYPIAKATDDLSNATEVKRLDNLKIEVLEKIQPIKEAHESVVITSVQQQRNM